MDAGFAGGRRQPKPSCFRRGFEAQHCGGYDDSKVIFNLLDDHESVARVDKLVLRMSEARDRELRRRPGSLVIRNVAGCRCRACIRSALEPFCNHGSVSMAVGEL